MKYHPITEKAWCEHIKLGEHLEIDYKYGGRNFVWIIPYGGGNLNFCPICAAPRPKVMTRREKLNQVVCEQMNKFCSGYKWNPDHSTDCHMFVEAIEFVIDGGGE